MIQISNHNVINDMRIVIRLWSDQVEGETVEDSLDELTTQEDTSANKYLNEPSPKNNILFEEQNSDPSFIAVLSKSQRKKLRKKANQIQKNDRQRARNRVGPQCYA